MSFKHFRRASFLTLPLLAFAVCFIRSSYSQSQTFSSGSTGSDGALNITAPGITYFNPKSFSPPLNPKGDNIFNFTTITIALGSTLKLTEKVLHGPVFFLATGDVVISGLIDLTGDAGIPVSSGLQADRIPSYGGSGGFGGGLGSGPSGVPLAGNGPGGGAAGSNTLSVGGGGQFTGDLYLVPLIGGSGGGGAYCSGPGDGGGAGGGAILIASSTSITINGSRPSIDASGGNGAQICGGGGGGSGGAIRLIAPTIAGGGGLFVNLGLTCCGHPNGSAGLIRLEAFNQSFSGVFNGPHTLTVPYGIALPATPAGALTVTSVNGITINANPFTFPDASINSSVPVIVNIQAQYIPVGTVPKLTIFSEQGADQVISCAPLQGTLQSSNSTATVTFPSGGSRGFVKATWTQ